LASDARAVFPLSLVNDKFYLANLLVASYLASPVDMSWKRAQTHAESMLENLGIGERLKGRKDLRGKKVIFVDDGLNPYRTMCFTIAAKLAKRRGAEIETLVPGPGEVPHAKVVEVATPPKAKVQRPMNRR
jgi:predicted phosphoribosyltransferase